MSPAEEASPRVVITGCSGGGKSSLLEELGRRGYATVPEPGRRIIACETDPASPRLPWNDLAAFAAAAAAMALDDLARAADVAGPVFFDRGLLDALVARQHATGEPPPADLAATCRYHETAFFTPPWPQIYVADAQRRHAFAEALAEYERLAVAYPALGYRVRVLPRIGIAARADLMLADLGLGSRKDDRRRP